MLRQTLIVLITYVSLASAHIYLTYPQWRGNNLDDNMQWQFPCGGIDTTTNRTKWPISGGAIAFQPGHNAGHSTAFMYINMFLGNNNTGLPGNVFNVSIKPVFQVLAPNDTNDAFDSNVCFQTNTFTVPNTTVLEPGMNATIQIIELTKNGNALYTCADITFEEPALVPGVPSGVCTNGTGVKFQEVFVTRSLTGSAVSVKTSALLMLFLSMASTLFVQL